MPLHKSLSEQSKFPRQRQDQWRRSKTYAGPANANQAPPPRPPIPVSASTKSKLQQFQYQKNAGDRTPRLTTVSNASNDSIENGTSCSKSNASGNGPHEQADATDGSFSTPVNRLAWQDLMGVADTDDQNKNTSPPERLEWANGADERDETIYPTVPRRATKRARSSSPIASPGMDKHKTPVVNVSKLKQALRRPDADPTLDLWDRFAPRGPNSKTSLGITNPALAHLMVSSSPRPPKIAADTATGRAENSLRRAMSCGSHWPKRRRVEAATQPGLAAERANVSKSSMVNALLETVNDEINKSDDIEEEDIGMDSPSFRRQRSLSPPKEARERVGARQANSSAVLALTPHQHSRNGQQHPKSPVSDYGDDDFGDLDDSTLWELDATLLSCQAEVRTPAMGDQTLVTPSLVKSSHPRDAPLDDEYDDLDDDLLAVAEELMAGIAQENPRTNKQPAFSKATHLDDATDNADDMYDDVFGGDFDFEAAELAATQSASRKTKSLLPVGKDDPGRAAIQRYLVSKVLESTFCDERGRDSLELILIVKAERSQDIRTVHLRGDWTDTPVHADSFVHIIGDFEDGGRCIIDNNQNILILHPDQLISATVVADSFSCLRRAVLQDRVKATSEASAPLVYGTLLHEIFQEALLTNRWDQGFLNEVIDRTMKKHTEDLYTIKVNFVEAREHLASKMPEVRGWAERFISTIPRPDAVAQSRNNEKTNVCISKLLDIEEHVWSPLYGLKGNIDATVQVTVQNSQMHKTLTVPFEVKTGKNVSESHQAQTMLYNLLLADRYDIEIVYGILYYMETSLTKIIPAVRNELRHMIKQRNHLSVYIRERSVQLPPMKRSKRLCEKCYAQSSCFVYHKLADDGNGDTSGLQDKFDQAVNHLTPKHQEFFLKWEDLLTKEEKESQKLRRELWTMLSSEREKLGRCFANVIIEEGSASEDRQTAKINRFHYTFVKEQSTPDFSFMDSQLAVGEPIVVSDEQGHFALGLGFVTAVRRHRISVSVDRRLHNARIRQPGFNEFTNQVYASIMEVVPEGVSPTASQGKIKEAPIKFRLDKDEFSNGMALVRNNIVSIMSDAKFGSDKIRRLVVDLEPPQFKATTTQYTIMDKDNLNIDQKKAVEKVMSAKDYALVLGMPGTGKTTTIAHIIRALVDQKKSVLLTSYTHTAVDNILLKLKDDDMSILRLGAPAKVHPEVREFATLAATPMETFEEIRTAWHNTPIVATTCLGINHGIFNERVFDYCIVDEASQITLPICLGPIRMARTFVLVGDHNQLPPLVQNEEARLGGLDISLFKLLSDTHPDSVVNLEHQYRMTEDIMMLSNTLIYEGRLKCGTRELRQRSLCIPNMDALQRLHFDADVILSQRQTAPDTFCTGVQACWLRDMVDPATRVSFINTDMLPSSREEAKGNRIVNPCEVRLVVQLVDALLAVGVPADEIGVMTHYRSQLSLLKHELRGHGDGMIEMHTADRFQGRDKEVVILSLVRSNEACNIGDLLKDWRRINVAFTRAKTKLLVVGSKSTLKGSGCEEMLARFIALMEAKCWIYDLRRDTLEGHYFENKQRQPAPTAVTEQGTYDDIERHKSNTKTPKRKILGTVQADKENVHRGANKKRGRIRPEVALKGKPNTAAILNDMMDGLF